MVTKLQRMVEIIEDRHAGEKVTGRRDADSYRGSVMNATPQELHILRMIAEPMNNYDTHMNYREGGHKRALTIRKKERLNELSNRRKNA